MCFTKLLFESTIEKFSLRRIPSKKIYRFLESIAQYLSQSYEDEVRISNVDCHLHKSDVLGKVNI